MWIQDQFLFTILTASRATNAKISAQETTPGHFFSTADFTASMTWNPLKLWLGNASFSALLLEVEFNSTEPSHPCKSKFNGVSQEQNSVLSNCSATSSRKQQRKYILYKYILPDQDLMDYVGGKCLMQPNNIP